MVHQPHKLSDILKEMAQRLLRKPKALPSTEAAQLTLMLANIAWNEAVGLIHPRSSYRPAWEMIEADKPTVWSELKSNDVSAMIDGLIQFKQQHHPKDQRRILTCGISDGRVRVDWLPPAAPGVDSQWEMRLYGLMRTGRRDEAIQFLRETRQMSRNEAIKRLAIMATK